MGALFCVFSAVKRDGLKDLKRAEVCAKEE